MSNKAPIDGYVDPAVPNPNKQSDAPIIIYGYVPFRMLPPRLPSFDYIQQFWIASIL